MLPRLRGKTDREDPSRYHPLLFYMPEGAATCEALLIRLGVAVPLRAGWVPYLAGLHGMGKADPLFHNKELMLAERFRHAGLDLPLTVYPFRHERGWDNGAASVVAQAVRGHHSDFQGHTEAMKRGPRR